MTESAWTAAIQSRWAALLEWGRRAPRRARAATGLLATYIVFYLVIDAAPLRYPYLLTPAMNANVAEASAWLHGRLDLEERHWDSAVHDGRVYSHFPVAFTLIALPILWMPLDGVPSWALVGLLALPLPALAYRLFLLRTQGVRIAVVLTLTYLFGTSLLPVLDRALLHGEAWFVNHMVSQVGVLLILNDCFGRRRIWPAAIGLALSAWSRQMTIAYAVPVVLAALAGQRRTMRLIVACAATAVVVAAPMAVNALKFGSPARAGYGQVYEGRDDTFARDYAEHGLFSFWYAPRNLYYMNLGLPEWTTTGGILRPDPNNEATGMWWTTPVLAYLVLDRRKWWGDRPARVWAAAAACVVLGLLLYHSTGRTQLGYNRYSLDYMAPLLAIIAPHCGGARLRATTALAAWSVWYFRWAIH